MKQNLRATGIAWNAETNTCFQTLSATQRHAIVTIMTSWLEAPNVGPDYHLAFPLLNKAFPPRPPRHSESGCDTATAPSDMREKAKVAQLPGVASTWLRRAIAAQLGTGPRAPARNPTSAHQVAT